MELHLEKKEVEKIILDWAEKEMPGRFNTLVFKSYNFVEPEKKERGGQ